MPATKAERLYVVAGAACPALDYFDPRPLMDDEDELIEVMASAEVVPSGAEPRRIAAGLCKPRQFPLRIVSKQETSKPEEKVILQLDEYQ